MKAIVTTMTMAALAAISQNIQADVLQLKNGSTLVGKYAGGNASAVRFETSLGAQEVDTAQILTLTFTNTGAVTPQPAATGTAPATAAAAQPASVTLPAGTVLVIRMTDQVTSKDKAGKTFAAKLEEDLSAGNAVAVKAGSTIYGKVQSSTQAKRARGQSTLDLRLTQVSANGKTVPVATSGFQEAGKKSAGKVAKGAAAGAAIGAIAGDAGKGAAIGAATGAVIRGETVTVQSGTLLEFTLTQPVTISP